jgi:carbon storage regulator
MLVLTRKVKESFWIDRQVRITVLRIAGRQVRLGIEAPKDLRIAREELLPVLSPAGRSSRSSSAFCGDG